MDVKERRGSGVALPLVALLVFCGNAAMGAVQNPPTVSQVGSILECISHLSSPWKLHDDAMHYMQRGRRQTAHAGMHLGSRSWMSGPGHAQVVPAGNYFAFINEEGNFQFGCQVFYPAIWNQCASSAAHRLRPQRDLSKISSMHARTALQRSSRGPVLDAVMRARSH